MMRFSKRRTALLLSALACSVVMAAGCGSTTVVKVQESTTITKGQELTDLVRALQEGAITQQEYDTLRERIMRRPN